jgi:hypothetical protein
MCPIEFWKKKFKNDLLASPRKIGVHTPLRNMRSPLIYPQLPHLHNHGLAILACITPFRNMCPPPIYPQLWPYHFIWKEIFEEVTFLLKYHQNPQESEHRKKEKKRENILKKREKEKKEEEEKEKLQESLQIKGKSIF